jgi:hypothetical protein
MNKEQKARLTAFEKQIGSNVRALTSVLLDPCYDASGHLLSAVDSVAAIRAAAMGSDSIFSALGDKGAEVAVVWSQSIADYVRDNGAMPSDHILSSAYQQLKNLVTVDGAPQEGMLLSALNPETMGTTKGLEIRANTAALVLPTLLANPLNEVIVYLPNPASLKAEIFAIQNVAGSKFGDFNKGDKIGAFTSGQYSAARQRWAFQTVPNGTLTTFAFDIASTTQGAAMPIRKGALAVLVNKRKVVSDYSGQGTPAGQIKIGATTYTLTATPNYTNGQISLTSTPALPSGTTLHAEVEIDIENQSALTPIIDQQMENFVLVPFYRYLGVNSTVQATLASLSEFAINTRSQLLNTAKFLLANEKAVGQLTDMAFRCTDKRSFAVPTPVNGEWKEAWELVKAQFVKADGDLLKRTERAGLTHLYASPEFVNFLAMLGDLLVRPAGYQREARIHFAGTLNGTIRVFEVPFPAAIPAGQALGVARSTDLGKAAYISGDVVPPMVVTQDSQRGFLKQDTVLQQGYDEVHPNGGEDFFVMFELTGLAAVNL